MKNPAIAHLDKKPSVALYQVKVTVGLQGVEDEVAEGHHLFFSLQTLDVCINAKCPQSLQPRENWSI